MFSLTASSRSLRSFWQGVTGWGVWLAGALALLVCAAYLRRWPGIFSCRIES